MKEKYKRLTGAILAFVCVSLGTLYLLNSFEENLVYFYSPTQILEMNNQNPKKAIETFKNRIRVGGIIQKDSVQIRGNDGYTFSVSDTSNEVEVSYKGLLPPMFREGQGVVAEGYFGGIEDGVVYFRAKKLITKHDENYMPPEVAKTLKKKKLKSSEE
jgi:cytochrome c-type biogenesis protein CcmE